MYRKLSLRFSDSVVQRTSQQSDGSCNLKSDTQPFSAIYSRNRLKISANTFERYILSKDYCIAHYDENMWFLPNCTFHVLIGDIKEVLQKWETFGFNYQHDCLCTLLKYRFSDKIVESGQVFDNVQRAVCFNQRLRGVDRMLSIAEKILMGKKYRKHSLTSL